jgi:hypothetical protein
MRGREKGEEAAEKVRMVNGDLSLGLENILFILVFFFSRANLVADSVRFNQFQTLKTKTEPNRKYFVIF